MPRSPRVHRALAAAVAGLIAAAPAAAQTPLTSGSWTFFGFGGPGSGATGQPFTFTSATAFTVTVLDSFNPGDQFQLFNAGTLVGSTAAVPAINQEFCVTPAQCLDDPRFSRGTFTLGPGAYSLTVVATVSPFGGGGAWIGANVVTEVIPEPSTWALLGTGMLALAAAAGRRRTA
jgi:hypothetical protein